MKSALRRWNDLNAVIFEQRIIMGLLLLTLIVVSFWDRHTIHTLEDKLRLKEYILAPGVTDFTKVRPQLIPTSYVEDFTEMLARTLGSYTPKDLEKQYRELEKYLAPDFRVLFREETKNTLKKIAQSDVSEIFSPREISVTPGESDFKVEIFGQQIRFVSGLKVFEGSHVMLMSLKALPPTDITPWALQVTNIERLSEDVFQKQRIGGKK